MVAPAPAPGLAHRDPVPLIDSDKCSGLGCCADACPERALLVVDGIAVVDAVRCNYCGRCETACPEGAIGLPFVVVLANTRIISVSANPMARAQTLSI